MKKLLILLTLLITSVVAFAEDRNAYVSNVKHYHDRVVVTVTAKESALRQYPNGFMVGVKPAKNIYEYVLITNRKEKFVQLSAEKPSVEVIFWCDEGSTGKKACNRYDFVVKSRP